MKKLGISLIIALIICLFSSISVLAVETKVTLSADKTTAKPGDTITVTLSASCEEGLSYVGTTIEQNDSVLTLQNEEVSSDWKNYGNNKLELMIDTNKIVKEGTLYTAVFKVNDNATEGETTISTTGIEIMDIASGEYTQEPEVKSITIVKQADEEQDNEQGVSLSKIQITKEPTKTSYTEGEKFDKTGMEVTATYSDGTTKKIENYTISPSEKLKSTDTKITVSYTEGNTTKTAEQKITVTSASKQAQKPEKTTTDSATNTLPNTGNGYYIFVAITLITVLGLCSYIGFKKYKEI